jgi:hypothetical protein
MIELSEDNFHQTVADHAMVAVVFVAGAPEGGAAALPPLPEAKPGSAPWLWGRVDASAAPGLARMFGVEGGLPVLMIMREGIVLYREPIGAASADEIAAIVARAARLDMDVVRHEIAQERIGRAALHERRVCPTARRLS